MSIARPGGGRRDHRLGHRTFHGTKSVAEALSLIVLRGLIWTHPFASAKTGSPHGLAVLGVADDNKAATVIPSTATLRRTAKP